MTGFRAYAVFRPQRNGDAGAVIKLNNQRLRFLETSRQDLPSNSCAQLVPIAWFSHTNCLTRTVYDRPNESCERRAIETQLDIVLNKLDRTGLLSHDTFNEP
jgi:hypothetical protein